MAAGSPSAEISVGSGPLPTPLPGSTLPSQFGASPYVEPGRPGDGAPHYNENNGYRRPGAMSAAGAAAAQTEADRIEPVLRRLWDEKKWDAQTVRTAMLALGYEQERVGPKGERLGGMLTVSGMAPRFEADHYVTPEGARVGLRVRDDACVTAWVGPTNYSVKTNGPYQETGCFEPPVGH